MRLTVSHTSRYHYDAPAPYMIQALRLTPPNFAGQRVIDWQVTGPGVETAAVFRDGFGNLVHLAASAEPTNDVTVVATGTVETTDTAGVVKGLPLSAAPSVFLRVTPQTKPDDRLIDLANSAGVDGTIEGFHTLMHGIRDAIDYQVGATSAATTAGEALERGKGVCQDHAHVFIAAARARSVPARYVNGYLLVSRDAPDEAHHAWAEVWIDGLGWVGFDPSNRTCPTDHYVRLATGLDAASAAPIRGHRQGSGVEKLDVVVEVQEQGQQQQQQQASC